MIDSVEFFFDKFKPSRTYQRAIALVGSHVEFQVNERSIIGRLAQHCRMGIIARAPALLRVSEALIKERERRPRLLFC